jgi:hypothetical protein
VPKKLWVSHVEASAHAAGTAYVTFDGHRSDDFGTWVFRTTDFGATWTNIGRTLPARQPVHVLLADRKNPRLVFVGTEFGVHVTLDGGESWFWPRLATSSAHTSFLPACHRDIPLQPAHAANDAPCFA